MSYSITDQHHATTHTYEKEQKSDKCHIVRNFTANCKKKKNPFKLQKSYGLEAVLEVLYRPLRPSKPVSL